MQVTTREADVKVDGRPMRIVDKGEKIVSEVF